jgi:hypothetical protein
MKRRKVLLHATVAVSLTAGCLSTSETTRETTTGPQQTTVEAEIKTLSQQLPDSGVDCSDEAMEPIDFLTRESYPKRADDFELTATTETITIGDEITFSLRNVGTERNSVGTIYKYTFQRREGDEWVPVYYTPNSGWIDDVNAVRSGGGYDWAFTFNQEGLERENPGNADHYVCTPLEPGTYRFLYWGVGEEAIATRFTVEAP